MTMIRIASVVSSGGRGSPSGGRSDAKLYANNSVKSKYAVRFEPESARVIFST